jgi:hypothetical protein
MENPYPEPNLLKQLDVTRSTFSLDRSALRLQTPWAQLSLARRDGKVIIAGRSGLSESFSGIPAFVLVPGTLAPKPEQSREFRSIRPV